VTHLRSVIYPPNLRTTNSDQGLKALPVNAGTLHRATGVRPDDSVVPVGIGSAVSLPALPPSGISFNDSQATQLFLRLHGHPTKPLFYPGEGRGGRSVGSAVINVARQVVMTGQLTLTTETSRVRTRRSE
jgi:hypothetical protein